MKFHFAVTGTAQADSEILLVEWLQDIFAEYNSRSGSPLDSYHVLVREDTTDNILWTGESVYCLCGHHIEYHFIKTLLASVFWSSSPFDRIFGCSFSKECKCQEFIPYRSNKELQQKN